MNQKNLKQEYVCLRYIGFEKRRNFLIGVNHVDFIELKPTAQLVVLLTLKIKIAVRKSTLGIFQKIYWFVIDNECVMTANGCYYINMKSIKNLGDDI